MIAIIDYGAGNTRSVMNALDRLDVNYILTDDADQILSASRVIFPGVGHAKQAMQNLKSKGLDKVIKEIKRPLLGICLGMQLLFEYSEEGDTECLGLIEGKVKKFDDRNGVVPQVGWNTIQFNEHPLFNGIAENAWFYSVHSYFVELNEYSIATSFYGLKYSTTVKKDNFIGTQFHPEKSSKNGAILLQNFLKI